MMAANGEKLALYASLGALLGLIFLLAASAVKLWRHVHADRKRHDNSTGYFRDPSRLPCPACASQAMPDPPPRPKTTTTASTNSRQQQQQYDCRNGGGTSTLKSSRKLTALDDELLDAGSTVEIAEVGSWRRHGGLTTTTRSDDRYGTSSSAAAARRGTSCTSALLTSPRSPTSRPVLELDDDY